MQVLQKFAPVFESPKGLPPHRQQDHIIVLKGGTTLILARFYRYPHYQKSEIEKIVFKLFSIEIIRLTSNPYSSPILLV